jgi:hypothetical protein
MGLSPRSTYTPGIIGLIRSSSSSCPLASTVGMINATSLGRSARPPQSTGPLLRQSYVVSALNAPTTRSASLDDSRRLPRMPGYTTGLCPTTWSGLSPRPSLLYDNAPSIRATTPTPGGGVSAHLQYFLTPKGLPQSNNGSAPPSIPTPVSVGGNFRRCRVRLMLRPAWLLAFLDWSDLTKRVGRRRRLHPSLPQRRSLTSRVGYDYTASPERYCGRTSTGWSAAVTGCALLRSQFPWLASVGRCSPPGFSTVQTGHWFRMPVSYPVPFGSSASASWRWFEITMAQPHLRLRCP